jgi:hypothetical protein
MGHRRAAYRHAECCINCTWFSLGASTHLAGGVAGIAGSDGGCPPVQLVAKAIGGDGGSGLGAAPLIANRHRFARSLMFSRDEWCFSTIASRLRIHELQGTGCRCVRVLSPAPASVGEGDAPDLARPTLWGAAGCAGSPRQPTDLDPHAARRSAANHGSPHTPGVLGALVARHHSARRRAGPQ